MRARSRTSSSSSTRRTVSLPPRDPVHADAGLPAPPPCPPRGKYIFNPPPIPPSLYTPRSRPRPPSSGGPPGGPGLPLRGQAGPGAAHRQEVVRAGRAGGVPLAEFHVLRLNGELTALGHGIAGVARQVHKDLVDLGRVR